VSAITYDLSAVGAIKALKFDTKSSVSLCFAKMMYTSFINSEIDFDASFITYVPMNKIKERQRGKNQAETLCRHLAWKLNLPIIPPPAIHADNTVSQHSLNSHERWKNAENIYIPTHDKVSGNIILVDDIMTTGATLEIMSQILLKAGAKSILCLTSATTLKD
ncbi:MAG: phosphoribosyltransferase family protein, partial [Oscillospiraceae bacterium]